MTTADPITEGKMRAILVSEIKPIADQVERNRIMSEKNKSFLFGNGTPGFDEQFRFLQSQMDSLIKLVRWVAGIAGAYVIVKVIEILFTHF